MRTIGETPKYSRTKVNWAGKILIQGFPELNEEEFELALAIISNWKNSHYSPLQTFKNTLRKYSNEIQSSPRPLIAYRVKRLSSIEKKLKTESMKTMKLCQMHDIGGCRVVLKDVEQVFRLQSKYNKSKMKHELKQTRDYIHSPRPSGYRSLHLIYRYKNNRKRQHDGLLIEIQIRSNLQHLWATAVETVDTMTSYALKSSVGPENWLRFFKLMGTAIAQVEGTPAVPDTPTEEKALISELQNLAKRLDVERTLESYAAGSSFVSNFKGRQDYRYYLFELNFQKKVITISGFSPKELDTAMKTYNEKEKRLLARQNDIVLVSVDRIKDLKKAYPNYYLDTKKFIEFMNKTIYPKT